MTGDDNRLFDSTPFEERRSKAGEPSATELADGDRVVRVLPDVSGLTREFDYICPAKWAEHVAVGSLVRADLNGRRIAGWVTQVDVEPPAGVALTPITKVSSVGPPAEVVELARWAAHRWHGRLAPILKAASPPKMVPVRPAARRPPAADETSASKHYQHWMAAAALAADPGTVLTLQSSPLTKVGPLIAALAESGDVLVIEPDVARSRWLAGALRRAGIRAHHHPEQWADGFTGGVVVGSRSAVWAPLGDLTAIVVLDEHDESLQEERVPTWHARDVAIERARRANARCVLVSPAPSLAAVHRATELVVGPRQEIRQGWPAVEVVDRRSDDLGFKSLFSSQAVDAMRRAAKPVAVLNRKGRARLLACSTCGELVRTEDGVNTMIEDDGGLVAPGTGERRPLICAVCSGTTLKRLQLGVTRAAEELARLVDKPVLEVSSDSRSTPTADDVNRDGTLVLGTEAALRAVRGCDLVVFLDFDQELLAPRYRSGEQAQGLLARAARLTGGRGSGHKLLIQTRMPDHEVVRAAVAADVGTFIETELKTRAATGWPPFGALAEISGAGADSWAQALAEAIEADAALRARSVMMGPRHDGHYLLSVSPGDDDPDDVLATLLSTVPRPKERVRVVVDPPRI